MAKCPDTKRLSKLVSWLHESGSEDPRIDEVIQALIWLTDFLNDRKLYHKKQQLKNKHLLRLAREHGLMDEAEVGATTDLHNHVSNIVDADEIDEILRGEDK